MNFAENCIVERQKGGGFVVRGFQVFVGLGAGFWALAVLGFCCFGIRAQAGGLRLRLGAAWLHGALKHARLSGSAAGPKHARIAVPQGIYDEP